MNGVEDGAGRARRKTNKPDKREMAEGGGEKYEESTRSHTVLLVRFFFPFLFSLAFPPFFFIFVAFIPRVSPSNQQPA